MKAQRLTDPEREAERLPETTISRVDGDRSA